MRMRHAVGPEARNQTWGRARASHAVRRVVTTVPVPMEEQCRRASARARKRKQSNAASEETKEKETESDRLRKKRCIQGESARARKRKQSDAASEETKEKETNEHDLAFFMGDSDVTTPWILAFGEVCTTALTSSNSSHSRSRFAIVLSLQRSRLSHTMCSLFYIIT